MSGLVTISVVGAKPRITAPQSGSASAIWMPKQTAMTPSSVTMKASTQRKPSVLQPQDQEHVERGDDHADLERNAEQQIEADRGADHLGEVGGADGDLGEQPQRPGRPQRGKASRQACARSRPEAMPSRAQSACSTIAMMLDSSATISSA